MKSITILGSTGSIGKNALKVSDGFNVVGLTAGSNVDLLIDQAIKFRPKYVAIAEEKFYKKLKDELPFCEVYAGIDGVVEVASIPVDISISAIVGIAGLLPTFKALENSSVVGIANKESIVTAGDFLLNSKAKIIPVDSEHSALFQILNADNKEVESIVLTLSGGPFLNYDLSLPITIEMATFHPTWRMGAKISIDSATWMNKGFEVIEAHYLFKMPYEKIDVIVHKESIIHGMVNYKDGVTIAHMGINDMRVPISYALNYPSRHENSSFKLDLAKIGSLHFESPNHKKFPCLKMAIDARDKTILLNAANDVAIEKFLNSEMEFRKIPTFIEKALLKFEQTRPNSIIEVFEIDKSMRKKLKELCI